MRIAIITRSNRVDGGLEEYLRRFLAAASETEHDIGFWYETSGGPPDRATIPDPPGGGWSIGVLGHAAALAALRRWRPDVIYAHGFESTGAEEEAYGIAPTVFFAHVHVGTCISGARTNWFPEARPCDRRLGPACLGHYFPRRCGGLNPMTMVRQYRLQVSRLAAIRRCAAVVTHSEYMRDIYVRHGMPPDRVFNFPFYVNETLPEVAPVRELAARPTLLFLGRMEAPKGGGVLLEALPRVRTALGRPLRVVFAGDGRHRAAWEARARTLQARDKGLRIEFTGWVDEARRTPLFRQADLLVVPSVWPEPFGQVGPEAGMYGVPAAAFAVGGTRAWLDDGVNGHLAEGSPPDASGLADAIVRCLCDPEAYMRLRAGAHRSARRFTWGSHYEPLISVLERASGRSLGADRPGNEPETAGLAQSGPGGALG